MNTNLKQKLECLYAQLNRREFLHPDPLEFVFDYEEGEEGLEKAMEASRLWQCETDSAQRSKCPGENGQFSSRLPIANIG